MKDKLGNRRDRRRERQPGRGGMIGVVVMVTAEGEDGEVVVVVGGLKVAAPAFEARLIKTLVQYLWWWGQSKEEEEERKVGQGASLIRSRKASQIDLSKTMTGLLRNINPHCFNIGQLRRRFL